MDLSLVERENTLLGQDFLTWLWYKDRQRKRAVLTQGQTHLYLANGNKRSRSREARGETKATTTVSSPGNEMSEARTGLPARQEGQQGANSCSPWTKTNWLVQISAADFGLSGLKTPKIATKDDEGDDPDAKFLEKNISHRTLPGNARRGLHPVS